MLSALQSKTPGGPRIPPFQRKDQKNEVGSASGTPRSQVPFNHIEFPKQQAIAARSIATEIAEDPRNKQISEYLAAIKGDPKGTKKDELGYPVIANIIIDLGEYLRKNDVSGIDKSLVKEMNVLVFDFLNDTSFEIGGEESKLWAVHVDIIWLAHEMRKKNILEEFTQQSILDIKDLRVKEQRKEPMNNLLLHNFNAIEKLWLPNLSLPPKDVNEEQKQHLAKFTEESNRQRQLKMSSANMKKEEETNGDTQAEQNSRAVKVLNVKDEKKKQIDPNNAPQDIAQWPLMAKENDENSAPLVRNRKSAPASPYKKRPETKPLEEGTPNNLLVRNLSSSTSKLAPKVGKTEVHNVNQKKVNIFLKE